MNDQQTIAIKEAQLQQLRDEYMGASIATRRMLETDAEVLKADIHLAQQRIMRAKVIREQRSFLPEHP